MIDNTPRWIKIGDALSQLFNVALLPRHKVLKLDDNTEIEVAKQPEWVLGIWECGDQRFTDPDKTLYMAISDPPPVPASVEMCQARITLFNAGLLDQIPGVIAQLSSPTKEIAQIEWEFRTTVRRDSLLVVAIAQLLSLSDDQVDDLFILAEGL